LLLFAVSCFIFRTLSQILFPDFSAFSFARRLFSFFFTRAFQLFSLLADFQLFFFARRPFSTSSFFQERVVPVLPGSEVLSPAGSAGTDAPSEVPLSV
jgi:hypothetical protein